MKARMIEFIYTQMNTVMAKMKYASDVDELEQYTNLLSEYSKDLYDLIKDLAL
jgi:hypothetical protein